MTQSVLSARLNRIGHIPMELCSQPPPYPARMLPMVAPITGTLVIGDTTASVWPAGMNTLSGTSVCGRSLAMRTTAPPAGAGAFSVTRPWVEWPPDTLPGCVTNQNRSRPGGVGGAATTRKVTPDDHGPIHVSVLRAHAPEVVAGRQVRHQHVVGTADVLDQQDAERAVKCRVVVDVEVVARYLRIRGVGPVELERKRDGGVGRRARAAWAAAAPAPC